MFEVRDVTVAYGARRVLDGLSLDLGPEPVAITGPSGSGKTTLLRLLAGQQRPDSGTVRLGGELVRQSRWTNTTDPRITFVHQDYQLIEFLSVADNLRLAAEVRGRRQSDQEVVEALGEVGLDYLDSARKPGTLSGGEQQRVAIARALVCKAQALIADEPTGALDEAMTVQVTDLLLNLPDHLQVIVATHDPLVAARMTTRVQLRNGAVGLAS